MLTRKENIFIAKKYLVENIFNSAYIKGSTITLAQVQGVFDRAIINNVSVDDLRTIFNLQDGWHYIFNTLDKEINMDYICEINRIISHNETLAPGQIRFEPLKILGTNHISPIPTEDDISDLIKLLEKIEDPLEKAIEYFCKSIKVRFFWAGNKRTATLIANKILIESGAGLLFIGKGRVKEFLETINYYYNTSDEAPLKKCLSSCICTISRSSEE